MNLLTRFNSTEEFIEELKSQYPSNGIVRVTQTFTHREGTSLESVRVVATFIREPHNGVLEIVRLDRYVGEVLIGDGASKIKVEARSQEIIANIAAAVAKIRFPRSYPRTRHFRAGIYEFPASP